MTDDSHHVVERGRLVALICMNKCCPVHPDRFCLKEKHQYGNHDDGAGNQWMNDDIEGTPL